MILKYKSKKYLPSKVTSIEEAKDSYSIIYSNVLMTKTTTTKLPFNPKKHILVNSDQLSKLIEAHQRKNTTTKDFSGKAASKDYYKCKSESDSSASSDFSDNVQGVSNKELKCLFLVKNKIMTLDFTFSFNVLDFMIYDNILYVIDKNKITIYNPHLEAQHHIVISSVKDIHIYQKQMLILQNYNNKIIFFDGETKPKIYKHESIPMCGVFFDEGFIIGDMDGNLCLFTLEFNLKITVELKTQINCVCTEGELIFVGCEEGSLFVLNNKFEIIQEETIEGGVDIMKIVHSKLLIGNKTYKTSLSWLQKNTHKNYFYIYDILS